MDPRGMVGGTFLHKIPLFNTTDVTRFENVKCVATQVRFDAKFFVLCSRSWKFFLFFKFPSLGECEIPPPPLRLLRVSEETEKRLERTL